MKKWFKKSGWIFLPISPEGRVIAFVTFILSVWVFMAVDRRSHSVSDTLIGAFPYVMSFLILGYWVAFKASDR